MFLLLFACQPQGSTSDLPGLPALGSQSHELDRVVLEVLGAEADLLDVPRDLAFNPERDRELWVVNQATDSVTIFFSLGSSNQSSLNIVDPFAEHFMEEVSSIAFGAPGTFGTCQESRNTYNGQYAPNDFMGPTLWDSDLEFFGQSNPAAVEMLSQQYGMPVDLGSHLDMQHESPQCMGIAWERDNRYWVFDGRDGAIDMVDFHTDHGHGYDDHSDGETATWLRGELARVRGVHSGMVLDPEAGILYVADTGNARILALDIASGQRGEDLPVTEPGTEHYAMEGAEAWTVASAETHGLVEPSGLALLDGLLVVGDHATGRLLALDPDSGEEIDHLDLGRAGLMGIVAPSRDELLVVDAQADELLRLRPAD